MFAWRYVLQRLDSVRKLCKQKPSLRQSDVHITLHAGTNSSEKRTVWTVLNLLLGGSPGSRKYLHAQDKSLSTSSPRPKRSHA
jgi:hypothetical protein